MKHYQTHVSIRRKASEHNISNLPAQERLHKKITTGVRTPPPSPPPFGFPPPRADMAPGCPSTRVSPAAIVVAVVCRVESKVCQHKLKQFVNNTPARLSLFARFKRTCTCWLPKACISVLLIPIIRICFHAREEDTEAAALIHVLQVLFRVLDISFNLIHILLDASQLFCA